MLSQADDLADAVGRALPGWVLRCVASRLGHVPDGAVVVADAAGPAVAAQIRDLGGRTPLEVLRGAVVYPTRVLAAAGVAPVERDEFSKERFPDDVYDLTPAGWADVDESLTEPGIRWMAARVVEHRQAHGGA